MQYTVCYFVQKVGKNFSKNYLDRRKKPCYTISRQGCRRLLWLRRDLPNPLNLMRVMLTKEVTETAH